MAESLQPVEGVLAELGHKLPGGGNDERGVGETFLGTNEDEVGRMLGEGGEAAFVEFFESGFAWPGVATVTPDVGGKAEVA